MDLQELATVTGVNNFVEVYVCVWFFYIVKTRRPEHFTVCPVNRNARSMFKALNKGFK